MIKMDLTNKLAIFLGVDAFCLIGLIIVSVLYLRHKKKEENSQCGIDDYPQLLIPTGFCAISLCVLILMVSISASHYSKIVCDKIVSIEMSYETQGTFVLGTGVIDNITYYITYEDFNQGQYKLRKFETEKTFIVETNDTHYYVSHIKNRNEFDDNYYIYVPVGTITKEFKL